MCGHPCLHRKGVWEKSPQPTESCRAAPLQMPEAQVMMPGPVSPRRITGAGVQAQKQASDHPPHYLWCHSMYPEREASWTMRLQSFKAKEVRTEWRQPSQGCCKELSFLGTSAETKTTKTCRDKAWRHSCSSSFCACPGTRDWGQGFLLNVNLGSGLKHLSRSENY